MGFAATWLRQVNLLLYMITLTTIYTVPPKMLPLFFAFSKRRQGSFIFGFGQELITKFESNLNHPSGNVMQFCRRNCIQL